MDDFGVIQVRTTELGSDYAFNVISDQAAGAGTSGIGNVELSSQGTDLAGKIGGIEATVFQGTQLRAANGYDVKAFESKSPMASRVHLVRSELSMGWHPFYPTS